MPKYARGREKSELLRSATTLSQKNVCRFSDFFTLPKIIFRALLQTITKIAKNANPFKDFNLST